MRLNFGLLSALLLAAATLVVAVVLASTAPAKPCAAADASLGGRHVAEAQKDYAAILKASPDSDCATKGMHRVLEEQCQRADIFRLEGASTEARSTYARIVAVDFTYTDTGVACAIRGLALLERRRAARPCSACAGPPGPAGPPGKDGKDGTDGERGPRGETIYVPCDCVTG